MNIQAIATKTGYVIRKVKEKEIIEGVELQFIFFLLVFQNISRKFSL